MLFTIIYNIPWGGAMSIETRLMKTALIGIIGYIILIVILSSVITFNNKLIWLIILIDFICLIILMYYGKWFGIITEPNDPLQHKTEKSIKEHPEKTEIKDQKEKDKNKSTADAESNDQDVIDQDVIDQDVSDQDVSDQEVCDDDEDLNIDLLTENENETTKSNIENEDKTIKEPTNPPTHKINDTHPKLTTTNVTKLTLKKKSTPDFQIQSSDLVLQDIKS